MKSSAVKQMLWGSVVLAFASTTMAAGADIQIAEGGTSVQSSYNPSQFILDMVHHNPGEARFKTEFLDPKLLKSWGFNGDVPRESVQCAVTFDSFDTSIFPMGSKERAWVENNAKHFEGLVKAMKEQGLPCYPFTDFIVLPTRLIEKYKSEICDLSGKIDIHRPKTQEIVRTLIDEIFSRFSDLGGITLRHGETYLQDAPYHHGNSPAIRGPDSHVELLKILREEICVKRNKVLFYRTWDFGQMHDKPEYYLSVTDRIEPHPNLLFSIKHQQGDFHRLQEFNPCLGIGKHRQIVEVCCQLDSYGKGAYPYYNGQGVIDGWEEYANHKGPKGLRDIVNKPTYAGTWTWSRGGGWAGPYIPNEFWCKLNTYVVAKWGQNPTRTEEDVFNEFAHRIAGINDAENLARFRKIAILSAAGTLRSQNSLIHKFNVWWNRDQYFDDCIMPDFKDIVRQGQTEAILKEKAESTVIWKQIERLSRELQVPDAKLADFIRVSCTYGRIKCEIIEQMTTAILLGLAGEASGKYDAARIKTAVAEYDELWKEWRELKKDNPGSCATIYQDKGFEMGLYLKGASQNPGIGPIVNSYRKIFPK